MKKKERVILERRFVPKGTKIIEQGDDAYNAYLIQSGSVSVYTEHNDVVVELARLEAGQICGEMALIGNMPEKRAANVKALEDCNLIVITQKTFKEKLLKSDPTVKALVEMLSERVRAANEFVMDKNASVHDMMRMVRTIEENLHKSLEGKSRAAFEKKVEPKILELMRALDAFLSDNP